uniref:C2H2-type domain-containing protein n=1 Tax=Neogobius melanostomus TaxID=47308 RepID=A0A8C6WFF9_9GOBI
MSSLSPGPDLKQEIPESPQIKEEEEEQSVKQEEEQLPVSVPESSPVCVKSEESSLLQQRQTEHREETQGEEPHFHSEAEGQTEHFADAENDDDDWEPPSSRAVPMETEAVGVHHSEVRTRGRRAAARNSQSKCAPETGASVSEEQAPGAEAAGRKDMECPFCQNRFGSKVELQMHIRVHTGDKPFRCSICEKRFADRSNLKSHIRTHSDEKPFRCSICEKAFTRNATLKLHMRIHTGEKPYSCPACTKTFTRKDHLRSHKRTHRDGDFSFEETLQLFNL